MRHLDLFSGIGGFALAAQRSGWKTIGFSEIELWCIQLLKKYWPSVPQLGSITELGIVPSVSRPDFHAKMYPTQAKAPDLPESVPDYGGKHAVPFAWYDHSTRYWRTWQLCLEEGWTKYRETWPRAGMTRNGIAYQRVPLAPLTKGTESGLWLTPRASDTGKGEDNRTFLKRMGDRTEHCAQSLAAQVRKPHTWPTPTARDYRSGMSPKALKLRQESYSRGVNLSEHVQRVDGSNGKLNPTWLEWLMGYPIGWTELVASEIPLSHKSLKSSSTQLIE